MTVLDEASPPGMYGQPEAGLYAPDMANRKVMGAQQARQEFAAVIAATEAKEDPVHTVVMKRSKAVSAVVPIEWYRRMCELDGDPTEL